jgi:hypothetical protein
MRQACGLNKDGFHANTCHEEWFSLYCNNVVTLSSHYNNHKGSYYASGTLVAVILKAG